MRASARGEAMARWSDLAFLAGRLLFGGFFVGNGVHHLLAPREIASAAAAQGVPAPFLAAVGTGLLLLFGGALVALGYLPRVGLALLVVFLVGVTPVMHAFWTYADPQARAIQLTNFTKNLALLGACLALAGVPTPWPASASRAARLRARGRVPG
jgi:uncharacterized membrane protein YphA (DoxX/SURF4 family)